MSFATGRVKPYGRLYRRTTEAEAMKHGLGVGAGGENRTRDIQLGKLTFYL